jgi:glycine cleavage system aminomethyltransferase T
MFIRLNFVPFYNQFEDIMPKTSPFEGVHRQLGATFDEYDGWQLPADFGDQKAETKAIQEHCAVVDLSSFGRITLKGSNLKEGLESCFKERKGSFFEDRWTWGRMAAGGKPVLCRVARMNGEFLLLTPPGQDQAVQETVEKALSGSATVTNITEKTAMLGLYGPSAFESMRGVLPFSIDELEQGDVSRMSFFMMSFTMLRGSWIGGEGLELICPAAAGPLAAGAVVKYRHKHNITPAGMVCLRSAMERMEKPL